MYWTDLSKCCNPWKEFKNMEQQMRLVQNEMSRLMPNFGASTVEFPAINAWRNNDDLTVTTELPGINPDSLDISIVGSNLTLRGERKADEEQDVTYHRRERWYGTFSKTVQLPFEVDANKVEAKYTKGILYLTLPRAESTKPKKIAVSAS